MPKFPSNFFFLPTILSYPSVGGTRGPPTELLGKCGGLIIPIFTPSRVFQRLGRLLQHPSAAPIKKSSPPRLLRILPWYRQIMMPCRTATITYKEIRQVTDGDASVLTGRCAVVRTFFLFLFPSCCRVQSTDLRCGICWEPRFVEPPPFQGSHAGTLPGLAYLATAVPIWSHRPPLQAPQEAPKGPGPTHAGHATKARGGGVLYP